MVSVDHGESVSVSVVVLAVMKYMVLGQDLVDVLSNSQW
jgi:hypothetical protein